MAIPDPGYGEALSPNGHYLLVAAGQSDLLVLDVPALESGTGNPLVGTLSASGGGAIEVAVSPYGRFAFLTLEDTRQMAVFDLAEALSKGFGPQDLVGFVPLGEAPVGMAISPDRHWLYATSEGEAGARGPGLGILSVIDLAKAESDPSDAVVATVTAGCSPVRVVSSDDGKTIWVTARESDALLGFSSSALVSDPARALVADVRVGEAPVGLALVDHDTRVVVADSNRFGAAGATADLTVVDTQAALAGRPAVLGRIAAGAFPREMAVGGDVLLVTNFGSGQVEAVSLSSLP